METKGKPKSLIDAKRNQNVGILMKSKNLEISAIEVKYLVFFRDFTHSVDLNHRYIFVQIVTFKTLE